MAILSCWAAPWPSSWVAGLDCRGRCCCRWWHWLSASPACIAARVAILPLVRRPPEATFVATIALAAIIEQGLTVTMGAAPRTAPAFAGSGASRSRASPSAASRSPSSWLVPCWWPRCGSCSSAPRLGRRMRAVAADRYMARAVGIPVGRYVTLSLALAGALAGIAGFLLGHQFLVSPTQGGGHMLKAYIAVALGGWGSVPGALLGALGIGVFETCPCDLARRCLGLRCSLYRGARRAQLAAERLVR